MKKLLIAAAAGLIAAVAAVALFVWLRGGRPIRSGEHALAGLEAPVTVRWDRWGVPAIQAESEADLAAALGWIHANDRFTQMELGRRAAFGRLSEILGEPTVEIDVYFRRHRFATTAERLWESARPRARSWLEAYAAGVNAWLELRGSDLPPELRLLGVRPEPWEGSHSVAFALLMARDLSFWNGRPEEERFRWLRAFGPETLRELLGDPELHVPDEILALARAGSEGAAPADATAMNLASPGSNNWALGASRTASGRALVANDPHLALALPSIWYQVHLRSPGFEAAGMTLPGAPAVILGRGRHVAWAFTNTMLDDHDVYFEELDEAGERYRRGDDWLPLRIDEETIDIRGGTSHVERIRSTDRGPLFEADDELGLPARSLTWTAYEDGDPLSALLDLASASTVDEARTAIGSFTVPAQNLVVGFETGEILFTVLGRVPQRRRGDGRLPSPGWNVDYGWDGLRPRDSNPTVADPASEILVTANHDARPPDYPLPFSADFVPGHRALRIRQLLGERHGWDWEKVGQLQMDVVSLYARDVLEALAEDFPEPSATADEDAAQALRAFSGWDHAMTSTGTSALYILLERQLLGLFADEMRQAGVNMPVAFKARGMVLRLLRGEMDARWFDDVRTPEVEGRREILTRALATAWQEGSERWGANVERWDYGEIHRLFLRHRLDAVPLLGRWMRRGPYELPGSGTTVAAFGAAWRGERMEVTYGPSMRWVTDWGHPEMAFAVLPGGQSGHPADPHYDDQIRPFLEGRLRPAPWSEAQIESATVQRMTLQPPP